MKENVKEKKVRKREREEERGMKEEKGLIKDCTYGVIIIRIFQVTNQVIDTCCCSDKDNNQ